MPCIDNRALRSNPYFHSFGYPIATAGYVYGRMRIEELAEFGMPPTELSTNNVRVAPGRKFQKQRIISIEIVRGGSKRKLTKNVSVHDAYSTGPNSSI